MGRGSVLITNAVSLFGSQLVFREDFCHITCSRREISFRRICKNYVYLGTTRDENNECGESNESNESTHVGCILRKTYAVSIVTIKI